MKSQNQQIEKVVVPQLIAVVGCDGSGKSTLTADLLEKLGESDSVQWIYLGQSSGNIAKHIMSLPVIGPLLGRYLMVKAEKVNDKKSTSKGALTVTVIYFLSLWRLFKFKRMLQLCNKGTTVITDRYPQAEVAGFKHDGTGLGVDPATTWFEKWLQVKEQKLYLWMANHLPSVVIRLNIDAETAHLRKPDHKLSSLQSKVAVMPKLKFNGATIVDLNSRDPYATVLKQALASSLSHINKATVH